MIVGENNSGKTNLLSALRVFYEDSGLKYEKNRDFPKIDTADSESWIELHFHTSVEEQDREALINYCCPLTSLDLLKFSIKMR